MARIRRQTFLLVIIGVVMVLLIIGVVVWLLLRNNEEPIVTNTPPFNANVQTVIINESINAVTPTNITPSEDSAVALIRLANLFTERFGSHSSEAQFQNLIDLKPYMTQNMQQWSDQYMAQNQPTTTGEYSGTNTKAVASKIIDRSSSTATVRVTARREDLDANGVTETYYQELLLNMKQIDGAWLVDKAVWQTKGSVNDFEESASNTAPVEAETPTLDDLNNLFNSNSN